MLEAETGLEVVGEASNGRDAVRQVTSLEPDIAVLDIAMPELNGIEAARMIRETNSSTRIIMLSMHAQTEYVFRALQAGANGYVVKDAVGAEVVKAIREVHRGHRYLSRSISDRVLDDYIRRREVPVEEDPLLKLSSREREVLQLIVEGRTTAEIAEIASLSPKTVETYRSRMMRKLEITTLPDLVKFAIQHGLTSLEG
jgi:DNA-binding NarL/FixJ family response regulator